MSAAEVARLLAALGDTPEAVAEALRSAGARGRPGCPGTCPVTNYLRVNGVRCPCVSSRGVSWLEDGPGGYPVWRWMERPWWPFGGLGEFIAEFDRGKWGELAV